MNSSEGAWNHPCPTQQSRLLAYKSPLQGCFKGRLQESPYVNRLDLASIRDKEMEDGFMVGLHRLETIK